MLLGMNPNLIADTDFLFRCPSSPAWRRPPLQNLGARAVRKSVRVGLPLRCQGLRVGYLARAFLILWLALSALYFARCLTVHTGPFVAPSTATRPDEIGTCSSRHQPRRPGRVSAPRRPYEREDKFRPIEAGDSLTCNIVLPLPNGRMEVLNAGHVEYTTCRGRQDREERLVVIDPERMCGRFQIQIEKSGPTFHEREFGVECWIDGEGPIRRTMHHLHGFERRFHDGRQSLTIAGKKMSEEVRCPLLFAKVEPVTVQDRGPVVADARVIYPVRFR